MTPSSYLPVIGDGALQQMLLGDDWRGVEDVLAAGQFERVGLDRFYRIYCDMLARGVDPCGAHVLDVGCNNGLIARAFALAGARVLGIDNAVVDTQGRYAPLELGTAGEASGCRLVRADLLDLLESTACAWDQVLLLSVVHHWRTGYAMSGTPLYAEAEVGWIFAELSRRCRDALYIECPDDEPGFATGTVLALVEKHLPATGERFDLGYTIGPAGYQRRLIRIRF